MRNADAANEHIRRPTSPLRVEASVNPGWILGTWLIGVALAALPLGLVQIPPISQHFYNLARMAILSDPAAFARNFIVRWDPMPDLAMDLVVPWLAMIMPVEQASRFFVLIIMVLIASGTLILARAIHGRWSALSLLGLLALYNWTLARGYANNLFALGLMLWALAAHVSLCDKPAVRVLVSSASALAIYFCHLFPLGLFFVVAGGWELGCLLQDRMTLRRLATHATAALVPAVLPLVLLRISSTSQHSGEIYLGWLDLWDRLKLCLGALMMGNRLADSLVVLGLAMFVTLALARRWLCVRPEWQPPLLLLPLLLFASPFTAFGSYNIVERVMLGLALLLPAILAVRKRDHQLQQWAAGGLTLIFLLRIGTVCLDWTAADRTIAQYRAALSSLPPGSVLFQFDQDTHIPSPARDPAWWSPPLDKVVALAALNGVLVPKLYLKAGQQPVLYSPGTRPLREFQVAEAARPNIVADDAELRAWLVALRAAFPDLHDSFAAVYVAVFDPSRRLSAAVPGARLMATLPAHRLYELVDQNRRVRNSSNSDYARDAEICVFGCVPRVVARSQN